MTLRPTRVRELLTLAVAAAAVGWAVVRIGYGNFPPISIFAGASLLPVAALETVVGFVVRARVKNQEIGPARGQLHPITVARAVALAKASAQVGAAVAGVWVGIGLWIAPQRSELAAAAADAPGIVVGVVAGAALAAAALWLEYCCRAPEEPPEDPAAS